MRKIFAYLFVCLLVLSASLGRAQSINAGDIRGTVTDPTGAVIPGTTVTVLNVDTGVSKDFTTNSSGVYDTNSIVPGNYKITFSHNGFEQLVRGPIALQVGFFTVNGQLKLGSDKQQVVVTSDVSLLTTESGQQSTTLDAKSMDELPQLQNRSWENLVLLIPGAAGTSATANSTSDAAGIGQGASINGNLPYSSYLQDGASTTLAVSNNTYAATFENVAELQVNTSSFSAQYGVGGAVFNTISKGGTDHYHGTIYDYVHTNIADANPYEFGAATNLVENVHYNNYGAALGGKVPFVKKAFFYINYDETTNHAPNSAANGQTLSTPTDDILSGNFTGLFPLYDPTTQVMALDVNNQLYPVRQSFASENSGQNIIPAAMQSKVAQAFTKYYPNSTNHPNGVFVAGNTGNSNGVSRGELLHNFLVTTTTLQPIKKEFGRLDYDITPTNRLTATSSQSDQPYAGEAGGNIGICPVGCTGFDINDWNNQLTDVWTINSKMTNELRLGYTYQYYEQGSASYGKGIPKQIGWQYAINDDFPDIDFGDGDWNYAWITKQSSALQKQHVYDPSDVFTIVTGKHILHLGGEFLYYRDNSINYGSQQSGAFGFGSSASSWGAVSGTDRDYTAQWTAGPTGGQINSNSGWAFADFLLGMPAHWGASSEPEFGARSGSPQVFAQDDWKIKPNLTINLGLRYEANLGWSEVKKNIREFDPNVTNSGAQGTGTLGAMWYASTGANGRTAQNKTAGTIFLPRVGFSWAINPKTTLRGGFGLYAYMWSLSTYGGGMGTSFGTSGTADDTRGSQGGGITPITLLDGSGVELTPNPAGGTGTGTVTSTALPLISSTTDPSAFNGQNVSGLPYESPVPHIMQWNLAAQRQIGNNLVAEIGYVASHSYDLSFPMNLNQIPESQLLPTGVNKAAIPYPQFGIISWDKFNATANYNSLQAQMTKRLNNGLSFNVNYVWSHMLDDQDSSGGLGAGQQAWQNGYNPKANYSNSNFDIRQALKGNVVYQLPFGKGKQFLNNNTFVDETIGGWEFSTTVILSTGNPFFVNSDQANYSNGSGELYPNWSGVPMKPQHRTLSNWINPAAFLKPADGSFGNVGRNVGTAPGLELVNMSTHKEFNIWNFPDHPLKLQVRMDAYNAFNHASFGPPGGALGGASGAGTPYTTIGGINSVTVGGRTVVFSGRFNF